MSLLTDFYNTVARFFRPQEETGEEASKSVATNRLKLVLMQDRTNLTPKILEQMRGELIDLLSKYLEMDKDLLELNFEQEGEQVALMLSIPVIRAKDEEEIEAALANENSDELEDEEVEDDSENAGEDDEIEEKDSETVNSDEDEETKIPESNDVEENNTVKDEDNLKNTDDIKSEDTELA